MPGEKAKVKTEEDTAMTEPKDTPKEANAQKAEPKSKDKEPEYKGKEPQTEEKEPEAKQPKAKQPKPEPSKAVGAGANYLLEPNPKEPAEARYPDHDVSPEVGTLLRAPAPDYTSEEEAEIIRAFITKVKTDDQAKELAAALERGEMPGVGR